MPLPKHQEELDAYAVFTPAKKVLATKKGKGQSKGKSKQAKLGQKTMSGFVAKLTELVEQEGHRCEIMFHRMKNPIEFYSWTLFDRDRLEEEWSITQREVSSTIHRHHGEDLRADLIEHVIETA